MRWLVILGAAPPLEITPSTPHPPGLAGVDAPGPDQTRYMLEIPLPTPPLTGPGRARSELAARFTYWSVAKLDHRPPARPAVRPLVRLRLRWRRP